MEQNKKELVYKIAIAKIPLTKESLLKHGFTEEEIAALIKMRMIEYTSKDNYKLVSLEKFRHYGVKLLLEGNRVDANTCFEICYQSASNGRNINLQILLSELIKKNYQKVLEIYANLEKIHPEKYDKDYNLFLYLLSFITECPKEYIDKLKEFTQKDIMLPIRGGNEKENNIREAIYKSKFKYAYKMINSMISRDREYSVKYELIRALLGQAIERESVLKEEILNLAKDKDYLKILLILKQKSEQNKLSKIEINILLITNALVKLIQSNTIPQILNNNSNNIYEALKNNDFKLALSMNDSFLESKQEDKDKDIINILLTEINRLIYCLEIQTKPKTLSKPQK